jgi:hypothetical protein
MIDVTDPSFFAPENMTNAVTEYCLRMNEEPPRTTGELIACVYNSLAHGYAQAVREIEAVKGKRYERIFIVGGGSKDHYLNMLTARYTGKEVYCGEFGVVDSADLADRCGWLKDFITLLNENKIGHAYWNYKEMDFGLVNKHDAVINEELLNAVFNKR